MTEEKMQFIDELQNKLPPVELPPITPEQHQLLLSFCASNSASNLITFGSATYLQLENNNNNNLNENK